MASSPAQSSVTPSINPTAISVLGTPLLVTDYTRLSDQCRQWSQQNACVALDFANTQIVTMRRHEPEFFDLTTAYDHFPPDGMPLVWCLNAAGAHLKDRVYGPTFMRSFLKDLPSDFTHYLLGGSAECGTRLRDKLQTENPCLKFVGAFHGKCRSDGQMDPADERNV